MDVTDTTINRGGQRSVYCSRGCIAVTPGTPFGIHDRLQQLCFKVWVDLVRLASTAATKSVRSMVFNVFFCSRFSQCFPVDARIDGDGQEICACRRVEGALSKLNGTSEFTRSDRIRN